MLERCARRAMEAVARQCSGLLAELWTDVAQHGGTPQNYRDGEIVFLPKNREKPERREKRMAHDQSLGPLGKAYSRGLIQPHMP